MESKKLRKFKSPSKEWHKENNPRWDCLIANSVEVVVGFTISLGDLSALGKNLILAGEKHPEAKEIFNSIHEILIESVHNRIKPKKDEREKKGLL